VPSLPCLLREQRAGAEPEFRSRKREVGTAPGLNREQGIRERHQRLLGGHRSHVGPASFGGLSGSLYSLGDGTEIQVNPGTAHTYQIDGSDVGPTTLVNIAAALRIVPRS